jgi:hypothetical protein
VNYMYGREIAQAIALAQWETRVGKAHRDTITRWTNEAISIPTPLTIGMDWDAVAGPRSL